MHQAHTLPDMDTTEKPMLRMITATEIMTLLDRKIIDLAEARRLILGPDAPAAPAGETVPTGV